MHQLSYISLITTLIIQLKIKVDWRIQSTLYTT